MKVAFLVRTLHRGGAERQVVAMARGLHLRGHVTVVLAMHAGGPFAADLEAAGVPVEILGKHGRWDAVGFMIRLVIRLRRLRPDVLYSVVESPNVHGLLSRPLVPGMRLVWGLRSAHRDLSHRDAGVRGLVRAEAALARFADRSVVNSEAGYRRALERGFPAERLRVVPNGIDTARFRPEPDAGAALRRSWGLNTDHVLIGLVGRADPVKGLDVFLSAAERLAAERPDVRFLVVGEHRLPVPPNLRSRVRLEPPRDDMPAVYGAIDVLCSASLAEGFPNVVGEAMACEVPVVCTDVGDAATLVGTADAVVPPGEPDALAAALRRIADLPSDDRRSLGARARRCVEKRFGLHRMLDATEAVLEELV